MLKYELYLNDILRAIHKIEKSTRRKSKRRFMKDSELVDATSMRIQIIGESIRKIPLGIKNKHKEINWEKLLTIRNIISHAYFRINPELVWSIVKEDIPLLKTVITKMKIK